MGNKLYLDKFHFLQLGRGKRITLYASQNCKEAKLTGNLFCRRQVLIVSLIPLFLSHLLQESSSFGARNKRSSIGLLIDNK